MLKQLLRHRGLLEPRRRGVGPRSLDCGRNRSTTSRTGPRRVALGDWPEARGPNRDGSSAETGLPTSWDLKGTNLLWRVPFGGRSAPIVMGNRVYVQNPSGRGPALQERVMALDADSGKVIWEYKFNIFQSDVPPHRVGWASPAADPETGNVYALGVGASLVALSRDGKLLWQRSIGEEFAAFTTHGGRTMSPIIDGDLVIVSAAVSNWGTQAARSHRIIALNKRTGEIVYVVESGRPPVRHRVRRSVHRHDQRHATADRRPRRRRHPRHQAADRRESVELRRREARHQHWRRRERQHVIISHGDENLTGNEMGMIAAIDGSQTGDIKTTKWAHYGEQFGFSSPLIDGPRVYQIENGSRLKAYDLETGKELWTQPLGTSQKAPPVMADGKIYRRHRKRQVLHRPPARRRRKDSERGRAAAQQEQHRRLGRHRRTGIRRRGDFARPRLLRVERRGLRDRPEAATRADRVGGERARGRR